MTEQVDDPGEASEPLDSMAATLEQAAEDAGDKPLLVAVDTISTVIHSRDGAKTVALVCDLDDQRRTLREGVHRYSCGTR